MFEVSDSIAWRLIDRGCVVEVLVQGQEKKKQGRESGFFPQVLPHVGFPLITQHSEPGKGILLEYISLLKYQLHLETHLQAHPEKF